MQRQFRLRKRNHFAQVYRRGKSLANMHLVLICQPGRQLQVGISVSKKLGKATRRNLVKRRLRECVRPQLPFLRSGRYIIVAREASAGAGFQELNASFMHLLRRGKYFKEG